MPPHAGVLGPMEAALNRMNPSPSGRPGPLLGKGAVPADRAVPEPYSAAVASANGSAGRGSDTGRRVPPGFKRHRARVLNPAGSPPTPGAHAGSWVGRGGQLQQAMDRQVVLLTWAREAQKREKNLIAAVQRSAAAAAAAAPTAASAGAGGGGGLAMPPSGALSSALASPAELRALLVDWSKANLERSQQLSTWATQNYQMLQGEQLSEHRRTASPPQTLLGTVAPPQTPGPRYRNIQPAAQSTPMSPVRELPESPPFSFKHRLLQQSAAAQAATWRRSPRSPPSSPTMAMEAEHTHLQAPASPSPEPSAAGSEGCLSSTDEAAATQGLLALRMQRRRRQQQAHPYTATATPWMTRPRQAVSAFHDHDRQPVSGGEDTATATATATATSTSTTPVAIPVPGPAVMPTWDTHADTDTDDLELEQQMGRVFPDDVLKLGRSEFAAWKAANQIRQLSPSETKALAKLRRKVLSRVYANRARARRSHEREKLRIENEQLRSLQSQVQVNLA